ncbi:multidrug efflux SMR transporter [Zhouia spongiae]|uniref:Guanidinium exporter n=1 Tax=Zhouia spongiae TaxID=2202721 RepID=A0ABY3YR43_9FLAO|nr:multidrug efflux SMR transporter [Zhouia spongiae]UNZ00313.1 multidrug efflux SMR transporter [Zhouia spongiae]
MNWVYLVLAGLFEIGWPLGLKLSQTMSSKILGIAIAIVSMLLSGILLWFAQKTIPIGTAYAVWTGIGAVGTLIIGILYFGDSASVLKLLSASLIVIGIVGLKFT